MIKNIVLAAAATFILAGATMTAPVTADAAMTCKDAAKMKYPDNRKMRHEYKKACKHHYKMGSGKTGMMSKFRMRKDAS